MCPARSADRAGGVERGLDPDRATPVAERDRAVEADRLAEDVGEGDDTSSLLPTGALGPASRAARRVHTAEGVLTALARERRVVRFVEGRSYDVDDIARLRHRRRPDADHHRPGRERAREKSFIVRPPVIWPPSTCG